MPQELVRLIAGELFFGGKVPETGMDQHETAPSGRERRIQRRAFYIVHKAGEGIREIPLQQLQGTDRRTGAVAEPPEQMLHLLRGQAPDAVFADPVQPGDAGEQHILMIPADQLNIRAAHHPAEHGNAAVAVPVDDIAQHIQAVGIPEAGCFQQPEEGIQRPAVKIRSRVNHPPLHPPLSAAGFSVLKA